MKNALLSFHIVVAITLSILILIQNTHGGLGTDFGNLGFYRTKRGAEKVVFIATIIATILFFLTSGTNVLVP